MKNRTKFKKTEIGMIPEDWEVGKLKDYLFIKGRIGWKGLKKSEFGNEGVIIINGPNIHNHKVNWKKCLRVPRWRYDESRDIAVKERDILMTKDGTIGKVAFIPKLPEPATLASGIFLIRSSSDKLDQDFLYQFFKSKFFKYVVDARIEGSVIPHLYQRDIAQLYVPLPPLPEQHSIAHILSTLDEKIELLQKQNKTLEEIGQAIFKRWFVDFEFPDEKGNPYKSSGGKMVYNEELRKDIPEGWSVDKMKNVSDVDWGDTKTTKSDYKKEGYIAYSASGPDGLREKFDYDGEGIVLSAIGAYCGKTWWAQGKWSCIKNTIRIFGKRVPTSYLFFLTKNKHFWNLRGGAQSFISKGDINSTHILTPEKNLLNKFDKTNSQFLNRIHHNINQIQTLSQIRDSLLPKLMSGKIRVPVKN